MNVRGTAMVFTQIKMMMKITMIIDVDDDDNGIYCALKLEH